MSEVPEVAFVCVIRRTKNGWGWTVHYHTPAGKHELEQGTATLRQDAMFQVEEACDRFERNNPRADQ